MEQQSTPSRKKFLLWSAVILSSAAVLKFFTGSKKSKLIAEDKNKGTVKMLTQDGKLVEIDKALLASGGKKITNDELQQWINK
jgi:predicted transcriptional regulator